MSVPELERALKWMRGTESDRESFAGVRLSIDQALEFRNAGNVPDENSRSLRLVLHVDDEPESLARKRAIFEPDYHAAPIWRREGSKPVNVVPLGRGRRSGSEAGPWWDEPEVRALEDEWQRDGTMRGVRIPADLRSFVHKTVLGLEAAGRDVDATSIADSIARWMPPAEAQTMRAALLEANSKGAGQGPAPS
ncbi:MAG TPA: hypothetical protein VE174_02270 [Actinomycetota bacterium]|nr:hypothetical protein [Actinomycetota bacterium]